MGIVRIVVPAGFQSIARICCNATKIICVFKLDAIGNQMTEGMRISPAEVKFSNLSLVDEGRVFRWNGKLFRSIRAEHNKAVQRLFSSGLIDALVKEGVFVHSRITDYKLDGFELVVEHQIVDVVSYPREWSFSMLKEAALVLL